MQDNEQMPKALETIHAEQKKQAKTLLLIAQFAAFALTAILAKLFL